MAGSGPVEPLRDSVAWPVQPVNVPLPVRPARDLEERTEMKQGRRRDSPPELTPSEGPPQDQLILSREAPRHRVGDLMTRDVVAISDDAQLEELKALLLEHKISGVPVIDRESGTLLGVVSQSDLLHYHNQDPTTVSESSGFHQNLWFDMLLSEPIPEQPSEVRVRDIMTPYIYFATPDASLKAVLEIMLKNRIHRVVITEQERLVGVVSSLDLLRSYYDEL